MSKVHVKTGDTVIVISGKDKGKQGQVLAVSPKEGKVIVEKVNMVSKHVKPRKMGEQGGIVKAEGAMYASKVHLAILRRFGPEEGAFLKTLRHQPQARAIKVQHLDETAAFVGENEQRLVLGVLLELVRHKSVQRVHARPQVARLQRDEDAQCGRKTQHAGEAVELRRRSR